MQALLPSQGGLFRVCPSTPPLPRFAFTFSMPSAFSGQRGYEPRFSGYGASHWSARGTSTLLNHALLSAHFRWADKPDRIAVSAPYS